MKLKKGFEFATILRLLSSATISSAGESPRFRSTEFELAISLLESAVPFNPSIPEAERRGLLSSCAFEAAKIGSFKEDSFIRAFNTAQANYLKTPPIRFVLATNLGIIGRLDSLVRNLASTRVTVTSRPSPKFNRGEIEDLIVENMRYSTEGLATVLISLSARNTTEAFDEGRQAADFLRGVWNISLNQFSLNFSQGPIFRPVSKILPGPFMSVHFVNGELAAKEIWYETNFMKPEWFYRIGKSWGKALRNERAIRSRLTHIKYRSDIEMALSRYARALDNVDPNLAFQGLWGLVEFLSNSEGQYDQLAKRLCFFAARKEYEIQKHIFQHLRDVRNQLTHKDVRRSSINTYLSQLDWFARNMIRFHIRSGKRFSSLPEAAALLDCPTDVAELKKISSRLNLAMEIQSRE